ncbi:hypothetical protein BX600DRAFT_482576 [Xylariales sp. PMI_506]|nr:hypothetical protein BX600DRAFT_482576 [Xylariales sp. PMI_506]
MPAHNSSSVCEKLVLAGLKELIVQPDQALYHERISSYWCNNQKLRPWFIVQPTTAQEVSKVLTVLVDCPGCTFAVRSGGNMLSTGGSNISDGVTIDLGAMNKTTYDPETKIASLQPGSHWADAYRDLEKHGVVVAGGRDGNVGIAGFTMGGGISWFLPKMGFSCNEVVNFEVVLADGRIVQANQHDNPDLFLVLKGAACNFGIVTRLDFAVFPNPRLWGGIRVMNKSTTAEQIQHLTDFVKVSHEHLDNYCVSMWRYEPTVGDIVCTLAIIDSSGNEEPPVFAEWRKIPAMVDTSKTASMAVFAEEQKQPPDSYTTWLTMTIKNDPVTISKIVEIHEDTVNNIRAVWPNGEFWTMAFFQPLLPFYAKKGHDRGPNVMGLDQIEEDALIFLAAIHVKEVDMYEFGDKQCREWLRKSEDFARERGTHLDWLYLNYADSSQDPLNTFGARNINKIKAAADKYDPTGVFQTRCPGGFKISKSGI